MHMTSHDVFPKGASESNAYSNSKLMELNQHKYISGNTQFTKMIHILVSVWSFYVR